MKCNNCGNDIEEDAIYCNYCGFKIEKIEEVKSEQKIKTEQGEGFKEFKITSQKLCIALLTIGVITSIINIIGARTNSNFIFSQMIFIVIFAISIFLLSKSNKIGITILVPFILLKMGSSLYYYFENLKEYYIGNLIVDEIFYLAIILLLAIYLNLNFRIKTKKE